MHERRYFYPTIFEKSRHSRPCGEGIVNKAELNVFDTHKQFPGVVMIVNSDIYDNYCELR